MFTTVPSSEHQNRQQYAVVTGAYWGFTLTDGALRMLVVLHFHQLGYNAFDIALMFVMYEICGVFTNLFGGWWGSRAGLSRLLLAGTSLQILALGLLTVPDSLLSVAWVMAAQALSGVAKDLNKMSAKSSVKHLVPDGADSRLLKWVARLTGSKNALKGVGFFLGALLLSLAGFRGALWILMAGLLLVLLATGMLLRSEVGAVKHKAPIRSILSQSSAINRLSAARFFLFGARDIWFVVALPVYLSVAGWSHQAVGGFLALWVIGYGIVQAAAPRWLSTPAAEADNLTSGPSGRTAAPWAALLAIVLFLIVIAMASPIASIEVLVVGLLLFGGVFAMNSALHSYLILHFAERDSVTLNVGFYYMSNAAGRLAGTLLSGWSYQQHGLTGSLLASLAFVVAATVVSMSLPRRSQSTSVRPPQ